MTDPVIAVIVAALVLATAGVAIHGSIQLRKKLERDKDI